LNQRESIPEYARLGESVDFFPSQFSQQFASLFSFFYLFFGFQRVFFFSFLSFWGEIQGFPFNCRQNKIK
jgi:hypothetical protein